ncbi:MAG: TetR/AcrR family transcriptional regulator [Verrucomicrobiales bacterium]|jgi:TetR/AcrR family transcriptional regulator
MAGVGTRQRILDTALESFGTAGVDGTSLDALARQLGLRKQSILYHFRSKNALFQAVVDEAASEFINELEDVVDTNDVWEQVEGTVRAVFRLAVQRPALLGLLREASRPGSMVAVQLSSRLGNHIEAAQHSLEIALKEGRVVGDNARLLLFSLYSTIMGVATEVEVLRAMGVEPNLRTLAARRAELLRFLRVALIPVPG